MPVTDECLVLRLQAVCAVEAAVTLVVDEGVVCSNMDEPVGEASLREVDLLSVTRGEREVEVSDELECRAADVHAMADRRRNPRTKPLRRGGDEPRGTVDVEVIGKALLWRFRFGTDRIVPWFVSAVAVAIVVSEHAASRSRSSHSGPTMQSLFRITTSARSSVANAALTLAAKPTFAGWRR